MNKYLLVGFFVAVATIGTAGAQTFTKSVNDRRQDQVKRTPPTPSAAKAIGAFPRTARNPIQLINPRAPQRYYGSPQDTVTPDDSPQDSQRNRGESPNRYVGVVLFGLRW